MERKALITGDWHFDNYTNISKVDPSTGLSKRARELLGVAEAMGNRAEELDVTYFLVLGDIFHKSQIPVPLYNAVYDLLRQISQQVGHLIILKGNHDFYDKKGEVNSIHSFRDIATVVEHPTQMRLGTKEGVFLPYTDDVDAWRDAASLQGNYLFTHMDIIGASYSGFERESTKGITEEDFMRSFDLSFSGHIHQPQRIGKTGHIVGAPMAHSFKDAGATDRGYILLDVGTGHVKFEESDYNAFMKVPADELHEHSKNSSTYFWVTGLDREQYKELTDWDNVVKKDRAEAVTAEERTKLEASSSYEEIVKEYLEYKGIDPDDDDYQLYMDLGMQALDEGGAGARLMSSHLKDMAVSVKNWFGFGNELQKFECTPSEEGLGLVRVNGINMSSQSRSSNGAGKTSIRKTLVQGFYGVSGKIKNVEVVNEAAPEDEKAFLRLVFTGPDGKRAAIERTVSHKGRSTLVFEKEDEDGNLQDVSKRRSNDTQKDIEDYIGLSREAFEVSISFDGENSYANASPSEKDEILNQLVGLHGYDQVYNWVKQRLDNLDLDDIERELEKNDVSRGHVERELASYKRKREEAEERYERALERHARRLEKVESEVVSLENQISDKQDECEQVESELKKVGVELDLIDTEQLKTLEEEAEDEVETLGQALAVNHENQTNLSSKLDRANSVSGKVECPTCFNEVDSDHLDAVVADFEKQLVELKASEEVLESKLKEAKKKRGKARKTRDKYQTLLSKKERKTSKIEHLGEVIDNLRGSKSKAKKRLQELEESTPEKDEVGSFEDEISEAVARLMQLGKTRKRLERNARNQRRREEILKFWKEGFSSRGIRNLLLDGVMDDLNDLSRRYSNILTAGETEVIFTSQTELASGEKRNKPDIQIKDVYGGSSYQLSSGGETRRINMIVDLAIHSLASRRYKTGFIFMDEIFTRVDSRGQELVMELLNEVLDEIPTIYLISNQEVINNYPFDNEITVVREGKQTRIEI